MKAPRLIGKWIFLKEFGETEYIKVKVIQEYKKYGTQYITVLWECGETEEINWDNVAKWRGVNTKGKILPILRLVK